MKRQRRRRQHSSSVIGSQSVEEIQRGLVAAMSSGGLKSEFHENQDILVVIVGMCSVLGNELGSSD